MIEEWKNLNKATKNLKVDVEFDKVIEKLDNILFVSKVAFVCIMVVLIQIGLIWYFT